MIQVDNFDLHTVWTLATLCLLAMYIKNELLQATRPFNLQSRRVVLNERSKCNLALAYRWPLPYSSNFDLAKISLSLSLSHSKGDLSWKSIIQETVTAVVERSREIILGNGTAGKPPIPRPRVPRATVLDDLKRPLEFTVSRSSDFICIAAAPWLRSPLCFVVFVFFTRVRSAQKSHEIAPIGRSIWISIIRGRTSCPLRGLADRVIASLWTSQHLSLYRHRRW